MELSEVRTRIDAVDDQLLELFLERMALSEEVAAYKNEHHLPILNKSREREILAPEALHIDNASPGEQPVTGHLRVGPFHPLAGDCPRLGKYLVPHLPGVKQEEITEIYSHEQAIGQCSRFLGGLKDIKVIPAPHTKPPACCPGQ